MSSDLGSREVVVEVEGKQCSQGKNDWFKSFRSSNTSSTVHNQLVCYLYTYESPTLIGWSL